MNIEEGNKLIAKFMDLDIKEDLVYLNEMEACKIQNLEYHESWDWLMPVVDKIDEVSPHGRTFIEGERPNP